MKLPITWDTYYKILVENLKHHAIGKLLVSFNQVSLGQKVYIVFCLGLYFYNIYQNAILCFYVVKAMLRTLRMMRRESAMNNGAEPGNESYRQSKFKTDPNGGE